MPQLNIQLFVASNKCLKDLWSPHTLVQYFQQLIQLVGTELGVGEPFVVGKFLKHNYSIAV